MKRFLRLTFAACVALTTVPVLGQEQTIVVNGESMAIPAGATPEQIQQIQAQMAAGAKPGGQPKPDGAGKADEQKKAEAGKPGGEQKPEENAAPKPVTRSDKPAESPNPEELKIRPDEGGLIRFQFAGQPWPALIEWFSEVSGLAVDWRELPGDYLNLRTQRGYTIRETQDLLNRHLLARGYTMIQDGEFLIVEKTENLNPSLVPRVEPSELAAHMAHEFARTSFKLTHLLAEDVVKELEPMKSTNGKLTALKHTNRIEAIDAVKNLRQINAVLQDEQGAGRDLLREFVLEHVRAADVRKKLEELLGIEQKSTPVLTPQQIQQMQQMQARGGNPGQQPGQPPGGPPAEEEIRFIVSERRNSLIAQAPPDKMFVIEEAVRLLDIPSNKGNSLDAYLARIRTYRLATLNPEEVVSILFETGGLDPGTQLRVDKESKAIIASAPPWDHMTIDKLVKKLDGSARQFKVAPLRRLRADQVATTIETLMVGPKQDDNRRPYYYWYDQSQNKDKDDKFRVGADVDNNRLLLWCNDTEYEQVLALLQELGEIRPQGGNNDQVRVLEDIPGESEDDFLRRVQEAFNALAPNPVVLPPKSESRDRPRPGGDKEDKSESQRSGRSPARVEAVSPEDEARGGHAGFPKTRFVGTPFQLVQSPGGAAVDRRNKQEAADETAVDAAEAERVVDAGPVGGEERLAERDANGPGRDSRFDSRGDGTSRPVNAASGPAPITISRDASGRLVISSTDTRALDVFEDLMARMAPETPDYQVFTLKYASASWVRLQLEDFFEEDEEDTNNRFPFFFFWDEGGGKEDKKPGLGDRRKIKFISEIDTNTILVRNATEEQLATVRDLIAIYDTEPVNTQAARFTEVISVKYSRASIISDAIKDAFRDLLSGNDKAFQQNGKGEGEGGPGSQRPGGGGSFMRGFGDDSAPSADSPKASFKGKLSIGVDDSTNTLIITTEGEKLMEIVKAMIKKLDDAARPSDDVRVITLPGRATPDTVKSALARMFSGAGGAEQGQEAAKPKPEGKPGEGQPPQNGQQPPRRGGDAIGDVRE